MWLADEAGLSDATVLGEQELLYRNSLSTMPSDLHQLKYISSYDSSWPLKFGEIASFLGDRIPPDCTIHHIGSTSIPEMPSKQIIDVNIECREGMMSAIVASLALIGYTHEGDLGIRSREVFKPKFDSEANNLPAHHLYACESGASELRRHLAFRHYLMIHPKRRNWLAAQKIGADDAARSRSEYIENKSAAYELIVSEAMAWVDLEKGA